VQALLFGVKHPAAILIITDTNEKHSDMITYGGKNGKREA